MSAFIQNGALRDIVNTPEVSTMQLPGGLCHASTPEDDYHRQRDAARIFGPQKDSPATVVRMREKQQQQQQQQAHSKHRRTHRRRHSVHNRGSVSVADERHVDEDEKEEEINDAQDGVHTMWKSILDIFKSALVMDETDENVNNVEDPNSAIEEVFAAPLFHDVRSEAFSPLLSDTESLRDYMSPLNISLNALLKSQAKTPVQDINEMDPLGAVPVTSIHSLTKAETNLTAKKKKVTVPRTRSLSLGYTCSPKPYADRNRRASIWEDTENSIAPHSRIMNTVLITELASSPSFSPSGRCLSPKTTSGRRGRKPQSTSLLKASVMPKIKEAPTPSIPPPPPPPLPPQLVVPKEDENILQLNRIQNRLRKRMMNNNVEGDSSDKNQGEERSKRWNELQARARKMTVAEFKLVVEKKRSEVISIVRNICKSEMKSLDEIKSLLDSVDQIDQWYQGGLKEMRANVLGWTKAEAKVDIMQEFISVVSCIQQAVDTPIVRLKECETDVAKLLNDFKIKLKLWGPIMKDDGASWKKMDLPVPDTLLQSAESYLFSLLSMATTRALAEVNLMYSSKFRVIRGKQLMTILDSISSCCLDCAREVGEKSKKGFLVLTSISIVEAHFRLSKDFYDNLLCKAPRAQVMAHFESVLKVVQNLNNIANATKFEGEEAKSESKQVAFDANGIPVPPPFQHNLSQKKTANKKKKAELINLKEFEPLVQAIYDTCRQLMSHIVTQSQPVLSNPAGGNTREVVLWLMFGCNFVNRILRILGPEVATKDEKMMQVLLSLRQLEKDLPQSEEAYGRMESSA